MIARITYEIDLSEVLNNIPLHLLFNAFDISASERIIVIKKIYTLYAILLNNVVTVRGSLSIIF